jgi:hypothetical protein
MRSDYSALSCALDAQCDRFAAVIVWLIRMAFIVAVVVLL